MCVNAEVSMAAFLFCSITSFYLYKRNNINDRWIAITVGYFGTMQLLEYLIWMDQECSGLNQKVTTIVFFQNILQPIVSLFVAYYMTNGKIPIWIYGIILLYIIYSVPKIWESKSPDQCSKPCKEGQLGLSWDYTLSDHYKIVWVIFALALGTPYLLMKKGYIYFSLLMGTFIMSIFIGEDRCGTSPAPSGSWWCLMATIIPFLAIFINSKK
tara:strand:- start:516 stop:1151 length:636 start_codon:yes stop_codon:yes gene_type:complete